MNWGKVIYVFFILMSCANIANYLYTSLPPFLFIAMGMNLISTFLKIGIRNLLSAELMASSIVTDIHLVLAFVFLIASNNLLLVTGLVVGGLVTNLFCIVLVIIESIKIKDVQEF